MWPFRKAPPPIVDDRNWNENWEIGDIAECVVDAATGRWGDSVPPWYRPARGERLTVSGFTDGLGIGTNIRQYFLQFSDWPVAITTTAFRKLRMADEPASEVVCEQLDEFLRKKTDA